MSTHIPTPPRVRNASEKIRIFLVELFEEPGLTLHIQSIVERAHAAQLLAGASTINAAAVRLAEEGFLERPRRGIYRRPTRTVQAEPEVIFEPVHDADPAGFDAYVSALAATEARIISAVQAAVASTTPATRDDADMLIAVRNELRSARGLYLNDRDHCVAIDALIAGLNGFILRVGPGQEKGCPVMMGYAVPDPGLDVLPPPPAEVK